jgi:hypothetical protein
MSSRYLPSNLATANMRAMEAGEQFPPHEAGEDRARQRKPLKDRVPQRV